MKPFIWEDERFGHLTDVSKLVFIGLITISDDEGRFRTLPSYLSGRLFPYDPRGVRKVAKGLRELADTGLICLYGGQYGYLPGWEKHQRISHRTPSLLPSPLPNGSGAGPEPLWSESGPSRARAEVEVEVE